MRRRVGSHERQVALRKLLQLHRPLRFMQAHDGLSALVADDACALVGAQRVEFDGLWLSSFADSAARGLPDASIVSIDNRLVTARDILRVSRKPALFDGDTGGDPSQFAHLACELEMMGMSGVVIEDKVHPKRNSLSADATHHLEDPRRVAAKIRHAKRSLTGDDFAIIARLEGLITGAGLDDALIRANLYVEAGADGILIHSREEVPHGLFGFASAFAGLAPNADCQPFLACVPTTYNQVTDWELYTNGFKVVIHGNHLIRAAYTAMQQTAHLVLTHDRTLEADAAYVTVDEISAHVGLPDVIATDAMLQEAERGHV
jgi:phosphoenolpyruvate phosphomutase